MPRASQHRALAYKQTKIKHGVALGVTVLITKVGTRNSFRRVSYWYTVPHHVVCVYP